MARLTAAVAALLILVTAPASASSQPALMTVVSFSEAAGELPEGTRLPALLVIDLVAAGLARAPGGGK